VENEQEKPKEVGCGEGLKVKENELYKQTVETKK